nr:MAG TPA: hypothetical protein [Caudoviricetes sp.]
MQTATILRSGIICFLYCKPSSRPQFSIFNFQFNKQVWRNWQTRMVQVHVKAISCRFKSCYLHHSFLPR